jgi:hypothetical protein
MTLGRRGRGSGAYDLAPSLVAEATLKGLPGTIELGVV